MPTQRAAWSHVWQLPSGCSATLQVAFSPGCPTAGALPADELLDERVVPCGRHATEGLGGVRHAQHQRLQQQHPQLRRWGCFAAVPAAAVPHMQADETSDTCHRLSRLLSIAQSSSGWCSRSTLPAPMGREDPRRQQCGVARSHLATCLPSPTIMVKVLQAALLIAPAIGWAGALCLILAESQAFHSPGLSTVSSSSIVGLPDPGR